MRRPMTITLMAVFALFCLGNGYADADKAIAAAEDRKPILVTGFEPFGGERLNSTEQVLGTLPDAIGGYAIHKLLLPVEFVKARELVIAEYDRINPAAVIMLGQAGGRSAITPETTAVNMMIAVEDGFSIPDNAGYAPDHTPIVEDGPETLQSTLPIGRIIEAVRAAGIPCERSDDAGRYVCNTVLYSILEHDKGAVPTGFIHVPYIREQGHEDEPYMELDAVSRGIVVAIETVAGGLGE